MTEVYAKRYTLWGFEESGVYHLDAKGLTGAKEFGDLFPAH